MQKKAFASLHSPSQLAVGVFQRITCTSFPVGFSKRPWKARNHFTIMPLTRYRHVFFVDLSRVGLDTAL